MNWLKKKFQGCYGYDQLSLTLLVLSIVITLISYFTNFKYLVILSYTLLFIAMFRAFSKNTRKRGLENYKFMIFFSPLYKFLSKKKNVHNLKKTNKIITCPKCQQKMKVPKKKGEIIVTCPKCKHKINTKS